MATTSFSKCKISLIANLIEKPKLEMTSDGEILAVFLIKNISAAGAQYFSVLAKNHSALSIYQYALQNQLLHISGELYGKQIISDTVEILYKEKEIWGSNISKPFYEYSKKLYGEEKNIILH